MAPKILAVAIIFLLGLFFAFRSQTVQKTIIPKGRQITLMFQVKKEPKITSGGQSIEVGDSTVYTDLYPTIKVGDVLKITGKADENGRMFRAKIEKVGENHSLSAVFLRLRQEISQKMEVLIPAPESTLLIGETLGVDNISKEFKDVLVKTGTIHVVVVSGENLMIVAALIMSFAKYIGRKQSLILATIAVFLYAALTGFAPPVVRASLMVLMASVGLFFGRNVLPVWTLGLAAGIILLVWPQALFEVSFQLTFTATLGIMTLGEMMAKKWEKFPFLGQNAAIATSAYLFTLPIILYYFGQTSLLSPIANIFVVELVAPIMVLGFLAAAFVLVFIPVATFFAYIAYIFAFIFVWVVKLFAQIPFGNIQIGQGNFVLSFLIYLVVLCLFFIWTRARKSF